MGTQKDSTAPVSYTHLECIGTSDSIKAKKAEKQLVKAAEPVREMKPAAAVKTQAPAAKIPETTKKVQPSERPAVKPQMVQKSPEKPVEKTVGTKQAVKPAPQPEKKQAANCLLYTSHILCSACRKYRPPSAGS